MKCCEICPGADYCQAGFWNQCDEYIAEFKKEAERVKEQIEYANKQHRVLDGFNNNSPRVEKAVSVK